MADCPWQHLTKEELAQANKMAAATVEAAVCVVCVPDMYDEDRPVQLRSFYQDLVQMAESEINGQHTGDSRFPVTEANAAGQSAGGPRLLVAAPEIVLAIAADPRSWRT